MKSLDAELDEDLEALETELDDEEGDEEEWDPETQAHIMLEALLRESNAIEKVNSSLIRAINDIRKPSNEAIIRTKHAMKEMQTMVSTLEAVDPGAAQIFKNFIKMMNAIISNIGVALDKVDSCIDLGKQMRHAVNDHSDLMTENLEIFEDLR